MTFDFQQVTGAGKRHVSNVRMPDGAGRRLAADIDRRTAAMNGTNNRTLDAATFGEFVRAATAVRSATTDDVRADERTFRHRAFRNRQRWTAHLVTSVASLAVLGGDPLVFMGEYRYAHFVCAVLCCVC